MKQVSTLFLILSMLVNSYAQNQNISEGNLFDGEPFLAINPHNNKHIVVAWMGYEWLNQVAINVRVSQDKGVTWSNEIVIPHVSSSFTSADPSMVFDNSGNIYLCYIDYKLTKDSGVVVVRKSTDGGYTWGNPAEVVSVQDDAPRIPIDRPWISVDTSSSANAGNLYVTTVNAKGAIPSYHPYFFVSTDDGSTWSNLRALDTIGWLSGNYIPQPSPTHTVSSDGIFYAAYPSYVPSQNLLGQFILAKSSDGGNTFTYNTLYSSINAGIDDTLAKSAYQIEVNPANTNHLVFFMLNKAVGDAADVLFLESFDGGNSWSSPQKVNDDNTTNLQDMLWVSFDKNGDLVVTWRDRRNGNNSTYLSDYEFFASVKPMGASGFGTNFSISDMLLPYDTLLAKSGNDFMCNQVVNDTVCAVWGDTRNGRISIWMQCFSTSGSLLSIKEINTISANERVYPNPSNEQIKIRSPWKKSMLNIYNIKGQAVYTQQDYRSEEALNIKKFPEGLYFYELQQGNNRVRGKFLKR